MVLLPLLITVFLIRNVILIVEDLKTFFNETSILEIIINFFHRSKFILLLYYEKNEEKDW